MASLTTVDGVIQTISFPFKDKEAVKKIAIGSALGLFAGLIIPAIIIDGYVAQIMKKIVQGEEEPELPEWDDWGKFLNDGFKIWGASLIFNIPLSIIFLAAFALMGIPWFTMMIAISNDPYSASPDMALIMVPMLIGMLLFFLAVPVAIGLNFIRGPALGHLVAKDSFAAAFQFKEWWPILRAGVGLYLMEFLVLWGISFVGSMLIQLMYFTIILACLLPFALAIYTFLVSIYSYTFLAIAYRDSKKKLG